MKAQPEESIMAVIQKTSVHASKKPRHRPFTTIKKKASKKPGGNRPVGLSKVPLTDKVPKGRSEVGIATARDQQALPRREDRQCPAPRRQAGQEDCASEAD